MTSVGEERVAVRLISRGYSDTAEILGLVIGFLLRTLLDLYKNKIWGDTEIGQNIIFSILDKSRSVAPLKREIKLVSP